VRAQLIKPAIKYPKENVTVFPKNASVFCYALNVQMERWTDSYIKLTMPLKATCKGTKKFNIYYVISFKTVLHIFVSYYKETI